MAERKYANGHDAEIWKTGLSLRAQSLVSYLANFKGRAELSGKLGEHKNRGSGCLYNIGDVNISMSKKL